MVARSRCRPPLLLAAAALLLVGSAPLGAQETRQQDPSLDNLVHPPGTTTVPTGTLGRVARAGNGVVPIVLIPSLGFSGESLLELVRPLTGSYQWLAVTPAGFGDTPPAEMPSPGVSYAAESWIRGAVAGIAQALAGGSNAPAFILGHGALGGRIAVRLAEQSPALVAGLILVGSEPARPLTPLRDLSSAERKAAVDGPMTRGWFRTVTKATWDANMWRADVYASDPGVAGRLWREVARVPLPTMVRYLSEFLAVDDRPVLASLNVPMLVLRPGFTAGFRADSNNANALRLMRDGWTPELRNGSGIEDHEVAGGHLFLMGDQPAVFQRLLDRFVARVTAAGSRR